jgi:hypothetical protein
VVINPAAQSPDWAFSYGDLWSYKSFGTIYVPQETANQASTGQKEIGIHVTTASAGIAIYIAQPSDQHFPAFAKKTLRSFLKQCGIAQPQVCIAFMSDQVKPDLTLVFNVFPEDYSDQKHFAYLLRSIRWYLPRHYDTCAVNKESLFKEHFREF